MNRRELLGIAERTEARRAATMLVQQDRRLVEQLVERRRRMGLTQEGVADLMGISQSAVARIESGNRDLHMSTVRRYAQAVGAVYEHHVLSRDEALAEGPSVEQATRTLERIGADRWDRAGGSLLPVIPAPLLDR